MPAIGVFYHIHIGGTSPRSNPNSRWVTKHRELISLNLNGAKILLNEASLSGPAFRSIRHIALLQQMKNAT